MPGFYKTGPRGRWPLRGSGRRNCSLKRVRDRTEFARNTHFTSELGHNRGWRNRIGRRTGEYCGLGRSQNQWRLDGVSEKDK